MPIRYGKYWVIQIRGDRMENGQRKRIKHRIKLCLATLPEREAQKIAAEELPPLNQGLETIEPQSPIFRLRGKNLDPARSLPHGENDSKSLRRRDPQLLGP